MKRWLVFYKDLWKILVHVTSCCIDLRQGIWCLTLAGTAAWLPPSLLCLEICWRKILVDFYLFWPSGHFGSSWNWFIHTLEGWFLLLQFSLTMCHFWNTLVSMYSFFSSWLRQRCLTNIIPNLPWPRLDPSGTGHNWCDLHVQDQLLPDAKLLRSVPGFWKRRHQWHLRNVCKRMGRRGRVWGWG